MAEYGVSGRRAAGPDGFRNRGHTRRGGIPAMIHTTKGRITDDLYVAGLAQFPIYLLNTSKPVLFDGGVTVAGRLYEEDIRSILGSREPEALFLTHAHWDHCGAISYLKALHPGILIAGSPDSGRILARHNAVNLIAELNKGIRPAVAATPGVDVHSLISDPFQTFAIDMELADTSPVTSPSNSAIEVLKTPGHTRDHLSYFIREKGILIASEASGCLDSSGNVVTEFLADYDAYIASLEHLSTLSAEILCQGHRLVFVGKEEVRSFLSRSLDEARRFKDRVFGLLVSERGSVEQVIAHIKREDYDTIKGVKQPENAYLLNLTAQVKHLATKLSSPIAGQDLTN